MSIRKIAGVMPRPKDVIGVNVTQYPPGWTWPSEAVLRQGIRDLDHKPGEVSYPGYGTVKIVAGVATFEPSAEYRGEGLTWRL